MRSFCIGAALDAWMIYPGWVKGQTQPDVVGLEDLVDHVVHICDLAGNCEHVGIGSDLDVVLENIDRFRGYAATHGTTVNLAHCLMTSNWEQFPDFLRYMAQKDGAK